MSTTPTTRAPTAPSAEVALRKALSSSPRPPRPSALSAGLTFGWRGMLKIKHVPEQLLDVTMTPVLFTLMFTRCRSGGRRRSSEPCSATACATWSPEAWWSWSA